MTYEQLSNLEIISVQLRKALDSDNSIRSILYIEDAIMELESIIKQEQDTRDNTLTKDVV